MALAWSSETLFTETDGELNLEGWAVVCLSPVWKIVFVNIGNPRIGWWLHLPPGLLSLTCGVYLMNKTATLASTTSVFQQMGEEKKERKKEHAFLLEYS